MLIGDLFHGSFQWVRNWVQTHPLTASVTVVGGSVTLVALSTTLLLRSPVDVRENLEGRPGVTRAEEPAPEPRYQVWYGTDRKPLVSSDESRGYSNERDRELHHGTCWVAIPQGHRFGSVGTPWWHPRRAWNWVRGVDDQLRLVDARALPVDRFWDDIRGSLKQRQPGERSALVYIHGYNTSFKDAAIRAAQIGFDLNVQGVTAFFSWASRGELDGYLADAATIETSEDHLAAFLIGMAQRSSADHVHVIAHSMGNRGLLRALHGALATAAITGGLRFGQIFLAAPDVDAGLFARLAQVYPTVSARTTLYVSGGDKPLWFSRWAHDAPRAGFVPPVTVVTGIDTIEVTGIDVDRIGHGYYAEAAPVLYDMVLLMRGSRLPTQRPRLRANATDLGRQYWVLTP